jgi:hypothetical protein
VAQSGGKNAANGVCITQPQADVFCVQRNRREALWVDCCREQIGCAPECNQSHSKVFLTNNAEAMAKFSCPSLAMPDVCHAFLPTNFRWLAPSFPYATCFWQVRPGHSMSPGSLALFNAPAHQSHC